MSARKMQGPLPASGRGIWMDKEPICEDGEPRQGRGEYDEFNFLLAEIFCSLSLSLSKLIKIYPQVRI